jgi:hypothetical protein
MLKDVMEGDEVSEPLIGEENGVLFMSVAVVNAEEDAGNTYESPVLFCPFCGTQLQTQAEVEAKMEAEVA